MPKKQPRRQSNLLPILLIAFGLVLVLGVMIWQALGATSTAAVPTAPAAQQDIPAPEIERVSLTDSKTALDNQQAVFLDVRDADSYAAGHIPGSINIPLSELETRFSELNPADWIITYCT